MPARSDVAVDNTIPVPPFWGTRVVKGIQLADYASWLDERATFLGQWGLRAARGGDGPSYEELVETEGRPRLRMWLDRLQTENLLEAAVVYGYFPCVSKGDDLIVLDEDGAERTRFTFPRQRRDRHLCLADFFRPGESPARPGRGRLPAGDRRRADRRGDREAVRGQRLPRLPGAARPLGPADRGARRVLARPGARRSSASPTQDPATSTGMLKLEYRGARFSLGYGACPNLEDRAKIVELLEPRPDRRRAVRGVPAAPGAVHRRDRHPPPGSTVFQCIGGTSMPEPTAVLFDMDGTLIDSEPVWFETEVRLLAEYGFELGPEHWQRRPGPAQRGLQQVPARGQRHPAHLAGAQRADRDRDGRAALAGPRTAARGQGAAGRAAGRGRARRPGLRLLPAHRRRLHRLDRRRLLPAHGLGRRRGPHQAGPAAVPAGRRAARGGPGATAW